MDLPTTSRSGYLLAVGTSSEYGQPTILQSGYFAAIKNDVYFLTEVVGPYKLGFACGGQLQITAVAAAVCSWDIENDLIYGPEPLVWLRPGFFVRLVGVGQSNQFGSIVPV